MNQSESIVKTRLKAFIEHKKMSQSGFEQACDISNGYVNNIRSSIGNKVLQNIIRTFPELNKGWLLFGDGDMLNKPISETEDSTPVYEVKIKPDVPYEFFQQLLDMQKTLIDSNKSLADANKELAESNKILSETNKKIVDLLDGKSDILESEAKDIMGRAAGAV